MLVTSWLPAAAVTVGTLALDSLQRLGPHLPFASVLHGAAADRSKEAHAENDGSASSPQNQRASLVGDILAALEKFGTGQSEPWEFSLGRDGEVRLESQHPARQQIEEFIAREPALTERIQQLFADAWKRRTSNLASLGLSNDADDLSVLRLSIQADAASWHVA